MRDGSWTSEGFIGNLGGKRLKPLKDAVGGWSPCQSKVSMREKPLSWDFKLSRIGGGEDLAESVIKPLFVFREIGVAFDFGKERGIGFDAGRLKDGVVLQSFGKDFPTNRVDGTVFSGIDDEGIARGELEAAG